MSNIIVSVAINVPVFQLFEYIAPTGGLLGCRVRVNFRGRPAIGIVLEESDTARAPAHIKLKPIEESYDDMPPLPSDSLDLIRFCAAYYHTPIGIAAAAAVPSVFRRRSVAKLSTGYRAVKDSPPPKPKDKLIWEYLQETCQTAADIKQHTGASVGVLKRLERQGALMRAHYFPPLPPQIAELPPVLTDDQKNVLTTIANGGDAPYLLFGDTGVGKTEVYLQLAKKALDGGGQVLILTPEIHLTPQLADAFARRFPDKRLCVMHSGLTDGARAQHWLMARTTIADVVLGTRSAVFTPLPKLRLIVVDEEHDDSYKQEEGMLFSARDIAVWRARREKTMLVCGSATPSLESYENARRRRYQMLRMTSRARAGKLHKALTVESAAMFHGMSQQFLSELGDTLGRGQQALIFINRRGYSPMLSCARCEWRAMCKACESRMTWHKQRGQLMCHRCGEKKQPPPLCPLCNGALSAIGSGTQRIEEALNSRFAPIVATRLDGDSLAKRDSFIALRQQIVSGEAQLLIGTQIVAKGHDFPHLSFIGILNADASLWSADFRAEEKLLMLLRQVIGRGTRNRDVCRVLIQTAHPEHPFYRDLLSDDLRECWRRLSDERRRAKLPPFSYCALLRASAVSEAHLRGFFVKAERAAREIQIPQVSFFEPVPSPVAKIANRRRWQLLAQSSSRSHLHRFLSEWRQKLPPAGQVRWSMDIDPMQI